MIYTQEYYCFVGTYQITAYIWFSMTGLLKSEDIQSRYDLAIALSFATTGLQTAHHPISIAFKIFCLKTGKVECEYQSLIKVSKGDWDNGDP
jgi:hypothetical protein